MDLMDGRVALVTGGAQGIGLAIAKRFADAGAQVVIADLIGAAAVSAAAANPLSILGLTENIDVSRPEGARQMVESTLKEFGRLDVLVNNAGITRDSSLEKMSLEDFRQVIDVHVQGTWLAMQQAVPVMRRQGGGGAIVNMSSISAKVGNFGQSNYAAAKAAIIGMTKSVAREVAKHGIRVNVVQPGFIDTEMTRSMPEAARESALATIPLLRSGRVDEVANVALFLASDLASYCTGITVEVAGGRHM